MGITGPLPDRILKLMNPEDRPKGNAGLTSEQAAVKGEVRLEKELHNQYLQFLSLEGFELYHHADPTKPVTFMPGWPDFTVFRNRLTLFIEFKLWPRKPTKTQQRIIGLLVSNGYTVYVLYDYGKAVELTRTFFNLK
jgi:hypothetical protein